MKCAILLHYFVSKEIKEQGIYIYDNMNSVLNTYTDIIQICPYTDICIQEMEL